MTVALMHRDTTVPPNDQPLGTFATREALQLAQAQAQTLAASTIVPQAYRDNPANCFMAMELATRLGASPMMVMQNVHIIEGKPGWSSQFVIAAINASKRFTPLRFKTVSRGQQEVSYYEWTGPKGNRSQVERKKVVEVLSCYAYAKSLEDGEMVQGVTVTTEMALAEGWYSKAGSKWLTMPEIMIQYRAAALFGRFYAPDILMGMQTAEELEDVTLPPSQWAPDAQQQSTATVITDPLRVEFLDLLESPVWQPSQRDALNKRWAKCGDDAEAKAKLLAGMRETVTPKATETGTADAARDAEYQATKAMYAAKDQHIGATLGSDNADIENYQDDSELAD